MRDLENLTNEDAQKTGWKIVKPFNSEVVGKAVYENDGESDLKIMKSTKCFQVPGGYVYNTSTEVHREGRVSVAEALVFVPDPKQ